MIRETDVTWLSQAILQECGGNYEHAFMNACHRLCEEYMLVDKLERQASAVSAGYIRRAPPSTGHNDVPPDPVTDDWIRTGREAAE